MYHFFFLVFDHFLHFPGLSYGSFTTSHKSLFLWIPWNQPMNTLFLLLGSIPLTTLFFNVLPLAEHIFIPLGLFAPGVCLVTLSGPCAQFLFGTDRIRFHSEWKLFSCFYFISNLFLLWQQQTFQNDFYLFLCTE